MKRSKRTEINSSAVTRPVRAFGLSKQFTLRTDEVVPVLRNVEFSAQWGTLTGIMGPSGCGKSTLLYCLSGLEKVDSGAVDILGERISIMNRTRSAKFRRTHLGFVFQSYNLVPSMSVEDNLKLPFTLRRMKFPRSAAVRTLKRLGIDHLVNTNVTLLSGGEQQRVALARVLVAEPSVVFADEPTGALDSESSNRVVAELKQFASHQDRAVVMVTHSAEVASQCDRVVSMCDGAITGTCAGSAVQ